MTLMIAIITMTCMIPEQKARAIGDTEVIFAEDAVLNAARTAAERAILSAEAGARVSLIAAENAESYLGQPGINATETANLRTTANLARERAVNFQTEVARGRDYIRAIETAKTAVVEAMAKDRNLQNATTNLRIAEDNLRNANITGRNVAFYQRMVNQAESIQVIARDQLRVAMTAMRSAMATFRATANTWIASIAALWAALAQLQRNLAAYISAMLARLAAIGARVIPPAAAVAAGISIGTFNLWGRYMEKIQAINMACVQLQNCRNMVAMARQNGMPGMICNPTDLEIQNNITALSRDAAAIAAVYNAIPFLDDIAPPIPRCAA